MAAAVTPRPRAPRRWTRTDLVVLGVPVLVLLVAAWTHRSMIDDGYINLRVVDQVFAGNGPVFNKGERVEAVTSPLWIAVLVALRAITASAVDPAWLAVGAGLAATGVAGVLALAGATRLAALLDPDAAGSAERSGARGRRWPLGLWLFVCTPPVWFFATSGLEGSLGWCWLAACQWGLVRRRAAEQDRLDRPRALLVLIGLGPLVRPDFALFALPFAVALVATTPTPRRHPVRALAWLLAVPTAFEVFRMGYYASLVPNTALAKSAGQANWGRGWLYLVDLAAPYTLGLAVAAVVVLVAYQLGRTRRAGPGVRPLVLAPVVGATLSAAYVVRLGGDYMHGRFLLPALWALVLPVAVLRIPPATATDLAARTRDAVRFSSAVVVAWGLLVLVQHGPLDARAGADDHVYGRVATNAANPVTVDDYRVLAAPGRALAERAARGEDVLVDATRKGAAAVPLPDGEGVVAYLAGIGVASLVAGPDVRVVDRHGLADPLAARYDGDNGIAIAGHEKVLPFTAAVARLTPPHAGESWAVSVQRQALRCGTLAELEAAVTEPMTPSRFLANVLAAPRLTAARSPDDPVALARAVCPPPGMPTTAT